MEFLEWLRRRALERHSVRPRKATGGERKPAPLFDAPLRFAASVSMRDGNRSTPRYEPPQPATHARRLVVREPIPARWC
jgi:hypothetical protein